MGASGTEAAPSTPQRAAPNEAGVASAPNQVGAGVVGMARPARPAALAIGSWAFHKIPERWQIQDGLGIGQIVKDAFAPSILVTEEMLAAGATLAQYVEAQSKMSLEFLE